MDSGKHSWSEVEILPPGDLQPEAGKLHPGPRSWFGCDVTKDKKGVVIWGGKQHSFPRKDQPSLLLTDNSPGTGVNPRGEREGDGWVIRLE